MIKLVTMVCTILILLCLSDINDNVRGIRQALKEPRPISFSEVEKRRLQDLDAALAITKVPR